MPDVTDPKSVEAEITRVRALDKEALRMRWQKAFGAKPASGLTKDIMARMICYRIQEKAFGALDRKVARMLDRLAGDKKPKTVERRLKPGTVVVREYQGERHTVTVVPDGFVWRDATYPSLTVIAKAITGTTWNGPRFFGLRGAGAQDADPEPAELPVAAPKRGRSSVQAARNG
jgi:hypothetical protein